MLNARIHTHTHIDSCTSNWISHDTKGDSSTLQPPSHLLALVHHAPAVLQLASGRAQVPLEQTIHYTGLDARPAERYALVLFIIIALNEYDLQSTVAAQLMIHQAQYRRVTKIASLPQASCVK